MIFVQPAYLPSVNYFKDFNDNDLVYNINLGLDESDSIISYPLFLVLLGGFLYLLTLVVTNVLNKI